MFIEMLMHRKYRLLTRDPEFYLHSFVCLFIYLFFALFNFQCLMHVSLKYSIYSKYFQEKKIHWYFRTRQVCFSIQLVSCNYSRNVVQNGPQGNHALFVCLNVKGHHDTTKYRGLPVAFILISAFPYRVTGIETPCHLCPT